MPIGPYAEASSPKDVVGSLCMHGLEVSYRIIQCGWWLWGRGVTHDVTYYYDVSKDRTQSERSVTAAFHFVSDTKSDSVLGYDRSMVGVSYPRMLYCKCDL